MKKMALTILLVLVATTCMAAIPIDLNKAAARLGLWAENEEINHVLSLGQNICFDDKGNIYIAWISKMMYEGSSPFDHGWNYNIYLEKWDDKGHTSLAPKVIISDTNGPGFEYPSLAITKNGNIWFQYSAKTPPLNSRRKALLLDPAGNVIMDINMKYDCIWPEFRFGDDGYLYIRETRPIDHRNSIINYKVLNSEGGIVGEYNISPQKLDDRRLHGFGAVILPPNNGMLYFEPVEKCTCYYAVVKFDGDIVKGPGHVLLDEYAFSKIEGVEESGSMRTADGHIVVLCPYRAEGDTIGVTYLVKFRPNGDIVKPQQMKTAAPMKLPAKIDVDKMKARIRWNLPRYGKRNADWVLVIWGVDDRDNFYYEERPLRSGDEWLRRKGIKR